MISKAENNIITIHPIIFLESSDIFLNVSSIARIKIKNSQLNKIASPSNVFAYSTFFSSGFMD